MYIDPLSFNSQRDGILLGFRRYCYERGNVSIPNGMEFYTARNRYEEENSGFNSQRDGILRRAQAKVSYSCKVSIPNGMEFYRFLNYDWQRWRNVSIPNGMEFYIVIL